MINLYSLHCPCCNSLVEVTQRLDQIKLSCVCRQYYLSATNNVKYSWFNFVDSPIQEFFYFTNLTIINSQGRHVIYYQNQPPLKLNNNFIYSEDCVKKIMVLF